MRNFIKSLLILVAILFVSSSFALDVKNYYVNGINNTEEDARNYALNLQRETNIGDVTHLYNQTESFSADLGEVVKQVFNWDGYYNDDGSVSSDSYIAGVLSQYFNNPNLTPAINQTATGLASAYAYLKRQDVNVSIRSILPLGGRLRCMIYERINLFKVNDIISIECQDFVDLLGLGQAVDVVKTLSTVRNTKGEIFVPKSLDYDDLNDFTYIVGNLARKGINLACHSQGNEFCNRLATHIEGQGYGDNVKVLSIATPDNYVYRNGKYVTLFEDLMSLTFMGSLPRNMANREYGLLSGIATVAADNLRILGDITGHGFATSYMFDGSNSKEFIVENFEKNHNDLKAIPDPYAYQSDFHLNSDISGEWDENEKSKYLSGGYSRNYTFEISSCRKVRLEVEKASSDSLMYLYANGTAIGFNDNDGDWLHPEMTINLYPGRYDLEYTTKQLFSKEKLNKFEIRLRDFGSGNCKPNNYYVKNLYIDNDRVRAGESFTIKVDQCYTGVGDREFLLSSRVGYFVSDDSDWSEDDVLIDVDSSKIDSSRRCEFEEELSEIPFTVSSGNKHILAVANYDDRIFEAESQKGDNVKSISIKVESSYDNMVNDLRFYPGRTDISNNYPKQNRYFNVNVGVEYIGNTVWRNVGYSSVKLYISTKPYFDHESLLLGETTVNVGVDDLLDVVRINGFVPPDYHLGDAYVYIVLDQEDIVPETKEYNNIWTFQVRVVD